MIGTGQESLAGSLASVHCAYSYHSYSVGSAGRAVSPVGELIDRAWSIVHCPLATGQLVQFR